MAKLCMTKREEKRRKMVEKYKAKRLALNEIINNVSASREDRAEARTKLQNLPRNSRGVYSKFGIARGSLRELMLAGEVPGVTKASW